MSQHVAYPPGTDSSQTVKLMLDAFVSVTPIWLRLGSWNVSCDEKMQALHELVGGRQTKARLYDP